MKVSKVQTVLIGNSQGSIGAAEGEFLLSPLSIFPDHGELLGDRTVGLRGGPIYAVLIKVDTDEGIYGLGSVGVGNGSAAYIVDQHLKGLILGQNPFNVELLWEKMFRSTINYGRKGVALEAISGIDIALWDIMGRLQASLFSTCLAVEPATGFACMLVVSMRVETCKHWQVRQRVF